MGSYRLMTWLAILSLVLASGCTSVELRKESISQLSTVHDLQQQQVLDNLAMFVSNRNSFPYFSTIGTGSCTVTDMASVGITNGWAHVGSQFLYNSLGLNPTVSRSVGENWQLNPINDSVRLTLMRCVYQKAVACCLKEPESAYCPDCNGLFDAFYSNVEKPVITSVLPETIKDLNEPIVIHGQHLRGRGSRSATSRHSPRTRRRDTRRTTTRESSSCRQRSRIWIRCPVSYQQQRLW